jgi:hypothetical protein
LKLSKEKNKNKMQKLRLKNPKKKSNKLNKKKINKRNKKHKNKLKSRKRHKKKLRQYKINIILHLNREAYLRILL